LQIVAIKKIRLEHVEEGMPSTAIREIAILREVSHGALVDLIDIYHGENKLYLIFEYVQHDVRKFLEKKGAFPPHLVKVTLFLFPESSKAAS
jgi:cyclin-dependent kinase 2